jgi:hypothetical protein
VVRTLLLDSIAEYPGAVVLGVAIGLVWWRLGRRWAGPGMVLGIVVGTAVVLALSAVLLGHPTVRPWPSIAAAVGTLTVLLSYSIAHYPERWLPAREGAR